jgi:hypothetical protein
MEFEPLLFGSNDADDETRIVGYHDFVIECSTPPASSIV